jgi:hypothetical protein
MLPATQDEIDHVTEYMRSQAPDLEVTFVQKVYSENPEGGDPTPLPRHQG